MIDRAALLAAFNMPPGQAVGFLRTKGLQVTESWRDLWQRAHTRAFTVARSAGYDVLGDIRDALLEALTEGRNFQQFLDGLTPVLQARGWWGKKIDPDSGEIHTYPSTDRPIELGSPRRLKLIYAQNLQTAFNAGRYREMMAATLTHPYWRYTAVMDSRTRPAHAAMNGRIFRHDDPAWSVIYPPCGWHCRCRAVPMMKTEVQREGAPVSTADGHIQTIDAPQKDGSVIQVRQLALPGMSRPFRPDPGWDYNPAADYQGHQENQP